MVKLALAAGGNTARDVEDPRRALYMGYPVELVSVMPKTEDNSQVPCLFGDLSQAATVGNRTDGVSVKESEHYKFAEGQITVLGQRRVAVNVHDVGDATDAGPIVGLITQAS